jgi:hypothetical protein
VEITTGGKAVIEPDTAINIAQWNYLLKKMSEVDYYTDNVMFVAQNILLLQASNFNEGQVFYDKESKMFYRVSNGLFVLEPLDIWDMEYNGTPLIDILANKVDKSSLPNRLYGTDGSGNQKTYTIDEIAQTVADVPSKQMTTAIIRNALTNINGRVLTAYEQTQTTISGYNAILITKGGNPVTEEQARDYMEYMTGSRFLPEYDYEKPQNTIFIMADGTFWKPQFDRSIVGNALVLYQISNPYELINNKVSTLSASSTNTQYPSAKVVYDNLTEIREVAEGKNKSIVLSYTTTAPTTDAQARQLYSLNGNHFESLQDFLNYVEYYDEDEGQDVPGIIRNSAFNSQDNRLDLGGADYIITSDNKVLRMDDAYEWIKQGDIILVLQIDVPDRWYEDYGTFNKMETSKVDIPTKVITILTQADMVKITYDNVVAPVVEDNKEVVIIANLGLLSTGTPDNNIIIGRPDAVLESSSLDYTAMVVGLNESTLLAVRITFDSTNRTISGTNLIYSDIPTITNTYQKDADLIPSLSNSFSIGNYSNKFEDIWVNNIKGVTTMTQAQYDALSTKDADTFYFIEEE